MPILNNETKKEISVLRKKALELSADLRKRFHPSVEHSLYDFCTYIDPVFFREKSKSVHIVICDKIQGVIKGEIEKLIINCPPRTGKSYITTIAVAWGLGYYPTESVIRIGADGELANSFSGKTKELMMTKKYKRVFPWISFKKKQNKKEIWSLTLTRDMTYRSAGVGATITGFGAFMMMIVDDSIASHSDCTPKNLASQWQWFGSVFRTRRNINLRFTTPDGEERKAGMIIIATRWDDSDLSGMALLTEAGEWDVVKFKALLPNADDPNAKSFCESIHSTRELKAAYKAACIGGAKTKGDFLALYQQEPMSSSGTMFNPESLKTYRMKELEMYPLVRTAMYIDYADQGLDYLSAPIIQERRVDDELKWFLVDCVYTQENTSLSTPLIINKIKKWLPDTVGVETNAGGALFKRVLEEKIRQAHMKKTPSMIGMPHVAKKIVRIASAHGDIINNMIFLVPDERDAVYAEFMTWLTKYTIDGNVAYDDAPDSLAGMVEMIKSSGVKIIVA